MSLPPQGQPISLGQANTEFGYGTDLGAYRGKSWMTVDCFTGEFDSTGSIEMWQLAGKMKFEPRTVQQTTYSTPGSFTFAMPTVYNIIEVNIYGAGGAGGAAGQNLDPPVRGGSGATTYFGTTIPVIARGGQGGLYQSGDGVGGDYSGPAGTEGQQGGGNPGGAPANLQNIGFGGAGGFALKRWSRESSDLPSGNIPIVIGAGGVITPFQIGNASKPGFNGLITIIWY